MLKYKGYHLIIPNTQQIQQINSVIDQKGGSIFHEVELNKIIQEKFNTSLLYLVDNTEDISCLAPIHITQNKLGAKRYNFMPLGDIPYAGFVGDKAIDLDDIAVGLKESFKYVGFPYPNNSNISKEAEIHGETTMVDLSLDENEIFDASINSKRRNMIRKALKNGIEVKKFKDEKGLLEFWPILEDLHHKLGYHHLNLEYYRSIFNKYAGSNKALILLAYKDNLPVSGIFILGNKNYMHYYKGASLFGVKNEGQGELLQWEAIKWSKENSIKYYDLCNLDKEKLPAIYRFKTGFSQNIIKYPKLTVNSFGYKIMNRI